MLTDELLWAIASILSNKRLWLTGERIMARCFSGPPRLPVFNINCNIWWGAGPLPPVGPPNIALLNCQITPGDFIYATTAAISQIILKIPAGTDIHWARAFPFAGPDRVEVPAGSGMWYTVQYVADVGRGFPNQYRFASIFNSPPIPTPLP